MKGYDTMAKFTEYKNNKGTYWKVSGYLGLHPLTGKQVNINKRGFMSKREAILYYSKELAKLEERTASSTNNQLTYEDVYREWLEIFKTTVKESSYYFFTKCMDKHVLPKFGGMKISKIQPRQVQTALNGWYKEYKAYYKIYERLLQPLEYAYKMGYISHRIKDKIIVPKKKQVQEDKKKFYTKDELKTVLDCMECDLPYEWYTLFRLLAFTGMRRGECLALTWNDINLKQKTISITKTYAYGLNGKQIIQQPKTISSIRTILCDDATFEVLKRWKREQASLLLKMGFDALDTNQLVFSRLKDNKYIRLNQVTTVFREFCKKNGFDYIEVHGFRHTHCSLLFESGVPIEVVKQRLGHSTIKTTMDIYTHVTNNNHENSVKKFEKYINF